ncbi:MAG: hypothetical protein Q8L29_01350 [archaeon]|nr:hypothetical protein [archaeon]
MVNVESEEEKIARATGQVYQFYRELIGFVGGFFTIAGTPLERLQYTMNILYVGYEHFMEDPSFARISISEKKLKTLINAGKFELKYDAKNGLRLNITHRGPETGELEKIFSKAVKAVA